MRSRGIFYTVAITFLAFHVALFMPTLGFAQQQQGQVIQTGQIIQNRPPVQAVGENNQYYLGQANELLIRVNVWGRVLRPGQYFVPATTDLITLISAAGGPIDRSKLSDVKVVRSGIGTSAEIIEVNLRKFMKTGDKRLIPDLKPEDTVIVSGSAWQLVVDILAVAGNVALIATAYYNFIIRKN
jgi:hypothetical protein